MIRISKALQNQNGTNGKVTPSAAPEIAAFFDAAIAILNRVAASEPTPARKETVPA